MWQHISPATSTSADTSPPTCRAIGGESAASLLLADGDTVELGSAPVARRLPGTTVWMPAYDGSTRVPFSRSSRVRRYRSTSPTTATPRRTVHWHGLRLDNPFDDVPHETQASIPIGGRLHPSPQVSGAGSIRGRNSGRCER
jgi:FtsP/CotA-like multicopper oxidase with cupredoxin domain